MKPLPPVQLRIPVINDKRSFIKRMSAFALVLLVLYYSVIAYVQARDNHKLLHSQSRSLAQVTSDLNKALGDLRTTKSDLNTARTERAALIRIAIAQNKAIKELGGQPVDVIGVGAGDDTSSAVRSTPHPAPAPSPAPPSSSSKKSAPGPSPSPSKKPSPSPSPTPAPIACVPKTVPLLGGKCIPG